MLTLFFVSLLFQCTATTDANGNVFVSGAGCTSALFVDAPNGDFHLQPGAPAIGKALCLPEVPTDLDGVPRPNRGPVPGNSGCDIGAFQFVAPNPAPAAPKNLRIIQP